MQSSTDSRLDCKLKMLFVFETQDKALPESKCLILLELVGWVGGWAGIDHNQPSTPPAKQTTFIHITHSVLCSTTTEDLQLFTCFVACLLFVTAGCCLGSSELTPMMGSRQTGHSSQVARLRRGPGGDHGILSCCIDCNHPSLGNKHTIISGLSL